MPVRAFILNFWSRYKIELLLFLAVFGVRFLYSLVVLYGFGQHGFVSFSDADMFVRQAERFLHDGMFSRFTIPPFSPDPLRTPVYLWFLAALLGSGFSFFGVVTVQNILAGCAGVCIYRIGKRLFPTPLPGIIATLLFAVEPSSVYWNNLLMSDSLYASLFLFSVYLMVERRWYWFSVFFAVTTLTRPVGLYLFPMILVFSIAEQFFFVRGSFQERMRTVAWRPLLKQVAIMCLIFFSIVFPWMLRNKILFNHYELSTAGWLNLRLFTVEEFSRRHGIDIALPMPPPEYHPGEPDREPFYRYEFIVADYFKENVLTLFKEYPITFPVFHIVSGLRGIHNHDYGYMFNYVVKAEFKQTPEFLGSLFIVVGRIFWLLLTLGTLFALTRKNIGGFPWLCIGLILFNALLIGYNALISGGGRYNVPQIPFWFLLGSYGWICGYRFLRENIRSRSRV